MVNTEPEPRQQVFAGEDVTIYLRSSPKAIIVRRILRIVHYLMAVRLCVAALQRLQEAFNNLSNSVAVPVNARLKTYFSDRLPARLLWLVVA
jgi:hypothetical protein